MGTFRFSEEKKHFLYETKEAYLEDIFVVIAISCWYALFTFFLTLLNPIVLCNACSA